MYFCVVLCRVCVGLVYCLYRFVPLCVGLVYLCVVLCRFVVA